MGGDGGGGGGRGAGGGGGLGDGGGGERVLPPSGAVQLARRPQSKQSVPYSQLAYSLPGPPSEQMPLKSYQHELLQRSARSGWQRSSTRASSGHRIGRTGRTTARSERRVMAGTEARCATAQQGLRVRMIP